jgi:predicted glycogen debranching enzyme
MPHAVSNRDLYLPSLGRGQCGHWDSASRYEWLVTNGLGGFACGTVSGANTRRYHGFLVASLKPPVERTLLVAKIEVSAHYLGANTDLSANEFAGGAISGQGFTYLESFAVRDGIPTWRYALADAILEQQIFMAPGANTSYLRLELLRSAAPCRVRLKPLLTYRDYHSHGHGARDFHIEPQADQCRVQAFAGARPYRLRISQGEFTAAPAWYWNFWHRMEADRGLDASEDLLTPGTFCADLISGVPVYLIATAETAPPLNGEDILDALHATSLKLTAPLPKTAPVWIRALAVSADQFIVRRNIGLDAGAAGAAATSIIAGYPWFTDWGRDTMISLPGLATALGRYDVAADILRTYANFVDGGMLPNCFPDGGEAPQYNTADATLWMFHALDDYLQAKSDLDLEREMFAILMTIVRAHVEGTRYGIRVDPADGLLRAGEPGTQLTWMDAKHGDQVFTPRIGKPVEINALWLNALDVAARLAGRVGSLDGEHYCQSWLERGSEHFHRFWNEERACLYDVIDVDGGTARAACIRPNQILAVALPYSVLTADQMRSVVECCGRELLTSHGLRTLSPQDPGYIGSYRGNPLERDAAYHMGTAWGWLLGPYSRAHYRVHGDAHLAQSLLSPMAEHLNDVCLGSLSEIFDGDAPHNARGCFAQAWSVAEILRSWIYLEREISKN